MSTPVTLIAHRGYSGRYPENTLLAYQKAYEAGARYFELDLQMTRDGVPILHHDASLKRMAGVDIDCRDITVAEFKRYCAAYPERFGVQFENNTFTTFSELCEWLAAHPGTTMFVELKQESIDRVGKPTFLSAVTQVMDEVGVTKQCVLISFNADIIELAQTQGYAPAGYVLPEYSATEQARTKVLNPAWVFCDIESAPATINDAWRGDWEWALYNADTREKVTELYERGFLFLETNEIGTVK